MTAPLHTPTSDGDTTAAVPAGTTANTTIKTGSGTLGKILVTSVNGAAAITIYDSASAASGTVIGVVPASAAVGSIYALGMPFEAGLTVGGASTNGAITVSYH